MKLYIVSASLIFLISCGNSTNTEKSNADTTSMTQPPAGDSTTQPTGVDNSSVISTDTAAMNHQNAIKKLDSVKMKK